jgi:hypothetical protein
MVINSVDLAYSVSYWLSYQNRIGREFMNSESSLKYPIADFLTNLNTPINQIKLEEQHSLFEDRYIDVTIKENNETICAFELKVTKYETTQKKEKQRILNDLLRLYYMNRIYNTDSYFIISGEHQQFMSFFRSISKVSGQFNIVPTTDNISDPIGFYTKWFKFSDKKDQFKKIIIKKETDKNYKELYDEFLSTYKLRNLSKLEKNSLPNYIMTECVAMTPIFIGAPLSHLVGIWKVY